ncbi:hypothetical protein IFM89_009517 [Coptis chinensis]|uniref:CMP/dCMP-type deaminase domain-containing protein n=1 Tax=Coptis chinensis TaxID=261450 RepID=A0A835LHG7_9MAGN|nr:hypothetical protein IFM89_009517 [Coptis chinensis]
MKPQHADLFKEEPVDKEDNVVDLRMGNFKDSLVWDKLEKCPIQFSLRHYKNAHWLDQVEDTMQPTQDLEIDIETFQSLLDQEEDTRQPTLNSTDAVLVGSVRMERRYVDLYKRLVDEFGDFVRSESRDLSILGDFFLIFEASGFQVDFLRQRLENFRKELGGNVQIQSEDRLSVGNEEITHKEEGEVGPYSIPHKTSVIHGFKKKLWRERSNLDSSSNLEMASCEEEDSAVTLAFMEFAMQQAKLALDNQEVPIGCVFVEDEKVIASGRNRTTETRNATRHAEMEAIDGLLKNWQESGLSAIEIEGKFSRYLEDADRSCLYIQVALINLIAMTFHKERVSNALEE